MTENPSFVPVRLARMRAARLEETVRAYQRCGVDTALIDTMRRRIHELEEALADAVYSPGVSDPAFSLQERGVKPSAARRILVLLSKKFAL